MKQNQQSFYQQTQHLVHNQVIFNQLEHYVAMLEQANKTINLTGFAGDKLWQEGIYESLVSFQQMIPNQMIKVLDVGSGAGFPGVPLKITYPWIDLTIYEPLQKRVNFLKNVSHKLNLHLNVVKVRSEDVKIHKQFDMIIARAVAPLKTLIEITHHLGKINCHYIFIKGPNYHSELTSAQAIINQLKLKLTVKSIVIGHKNVVIISYFKTHQTPSYFPRPWHIIKAQKDL